MRGRDDLVSRLVLERSHGEVERISAVRTGHAVFGACRGRELPLEGIDIWSTDERAVANDRCDRTIDLIFDRLILEPEIRIRYRHEWRSLVLALEQAGGISSIAAGL